MSRIECEVTETTKEGQPAVTVTCTECGHETTSFGTTERSVKRCLAMMREECPKGQENYYVEEDD